MSNNGRDDFDDYARELRDVEYDRFGTPEQHGGAEHGKPQPIFPGALHVAMPESAIDQPRPELAGETVAPPPGIIFKAARADSFCEWEEDDEGVWETDCNEAFQFSSDGPVQNGFNFCPFCGKPIIHHNATRADSFGDGVGCEERFL